MKTEEEVISELQSQGYDKVYVWNAEPDEIDDEHSHDFDTKLYILDGQIRLKVLIDDVITDLKLNSENELLVTRGQIHSAVAGSEGCRYVVAEKH